MKGGREWEPQRAAPSSNGGEGRRLHATLIAALKVLPLGVLRGVRLAWGVGRRHQP